MKVLIYEGHNGWSTARIMDDLHIPYLFVPSVKKIPPAEEWTHLLLGGGRDILTSWYGEKNQFARQADRARDVVEWFMTRRALAEGKPILGICRGMQLLAVAQGGSLWQDVNYQNVTGEQHSTGFHHISVKPKLADFIPTNFVNSRHHQAVKYVPYGMEILAKSADGIIEAIYRPGVLGVQWHPEDLYVKSRKWGSLFAWFGDGLQ